MNAKKRTTAALSASAIVVALGAGLIPAGPVAAQDPQTIRMWTWSQWNGLTGLEPDGQPLDWWKAKVDEWAAQHPGVTVEIEDLNGQDLDINAKYDTAVAAVRL